jgi:hypothetical protein
MENLTAPMIWKWQKHWKFLQFWERAPGEMSVGKRENSCRGQIFWLGWVRWFEVFLCALLAL